MIPHPPDQLRRGELDFDPGLHLRGKVRRGALAGHVDLAPSQPRRPAPTQLRRAFALRLSVVTGGPGRSGRGRRVSLTRGPGLWSKQT
jgi:hypothetical protein